MYTWLEEHLTGVRLEKRISNEVIQSPGFRFQGCCGMLESSSHCNGTMGFPESSLLLSPDTSAIMVHCYGSGRSSP